MESLKCGILRTGIGELSLNNVLQCGQAFRWVYNSKNLQYSTTMKVGDTYKVVILQQPDETTIKFTGLGLEGSDLTPLKDHLHDYFRLDLSLVQMHSEDWLTRDSSFQTKCPRGVRLLNQEPWETLVSFICSSNNNIYRITKMCHNLCEHFGNKVGTLDGIDYYSFPTSEELCSRASEDKLRTLGFGYRAKYIIGTAAKMASDKQNLSETEYLSNLKDHLTYEQIREQFMSYPGVGPKVADCACLMGMKMDDVVPVDVHIARIAQRDYRFTPNKASLKELQEKYKDLPITRKKINYELDLIRIMFKEKWGEYAGWAQCVLFAQEMGKIAGATTEGLVSKRKVKSEYEIEIKGEDLEVKLEDVEETVTEKIEYSITGRPRRRATKKVKYEF